jgi:uncharacterized repeat protein (TIGR01451 family)
LPAIKNAILPANRKMLLTAIKIKDMKSFVKNILAACLLVIFYTVAAAQPAYSDISISAISLAAAGPIKKVPVISSSSNPANHPVALTASDDILKCTITVSNAGSANAFGAKLIIVLPAGATVPAGTLPSNATLVSDRVATGGGPGYIQFDLAVVFSNQPITVEFSFKKSGSVNKLSAFVICGVPDSNPANNYKEASY